jgi:translation initiation factor IF-2
MVDEGGNRLDAAPPAKAVEITGLSGLPAPGETFYVVGDEKQAREIALKRQEKEKSQQVTPVSRLTLEDLARQIKEGSVKELNLIIKADVHGSLEALIGSLEKIGSSEVAIKLIHKGVGNINVSDVMLAAVSGSVIVGFHVSVETEAAKAAKKQSVDIRLYDIIYKVTQDVKGALEGMLKPEIKEHFLGRAQVRQVFKISKVGAVAGSYVIAGKVCRGFHCRIIRDNEVLFEGRISSLKRFKEDVKEVAKGFECGIGVGGFKNLKPADLIEVFEEEKITRKL